MASSLKLGEDFDIEDMSVQLSGILEGLNELANSEDLRATLSGISQILNDENTRALTATVNRTLQEIRSTAADASDLIQSTGGHIDQIAADMRPAVSELARMMAQAEQTLASLDEQLAGDSVQMYQLQTTLEEVETAARALREFFDTLQRNPEALLSGKE